MGFAIKVVYAYNKYMTYFVQGANKDKAIKRAYERFKEEWEIQSLPESVEEAMQDEKIYIEVLAEIESIIL